MEFLDSSLFKAFYWAATELNFTRAAQKAAMTQSGVSQQVAKLEAQLRVPLFERVNKQVFLTPAGDQLMQYIDRQNDEIAKLKEFIHSELQVVSGQVRYAMPQSCLFTPHFAELLEKRKTFPEVRLKVDLCPNEEVFAKLLGREIDFGFVTRESQNPAIQHERFAREEYILVGSSKLDEPSYRPKEILGLPFVDYPGMHVLFEIWREHFFPTSRMLTHESLRPVGTINSLHGAVTMLLEGVGYSVMPTHCAEPWIGKRKLREFAPNKSKVFADIYIVTLVGYHLPSRVQHVIGAFREMKKI